MLTNLFIRLINYLYYFFRLSADLWLCCFLRLILQLNRIIHMKYYNNIYLIIIYYSQYNLHSRILQCLSTRLKRQSLNILIYWKQQNQKKLVNMEDNQSTLFKQTSQHESGSKFQYEWKQGFKDTIQIQNRIKILELEKQKKIKDIEKKLNLHKRNVGLKILKHQRHQAVGNLHDKERMNQTSYFNRFQEDKKKREDNIKNLKLQLIQTKNKQFWSVKRQREEINRKISQQKMQEHLQKIEKRNKVRLMEIQSKQNVVSSWNRRLEEMKRNRQRVIDKKLKQHEQNLISIAKFTKMEDKMLMEISKAEDMEQELSVMIEKENKLTGYQLSKLYTTQA